MHIPRHRHRILLLTIFVLAGTGVLLSRLHDYQITNRESYIDKLPQPYEVTVREPGVRGIILDRSGKTLASNKRNYEVSLNLQEIYKAYIDDKNTLYIDKGEKFRDINKIINIYLRPRLEQFDLDRPEENIPGLSAHYNTHRGLIPFIFRNDLSYDEFASAAEHNVSLPGVYIGVRPQRQYPYGSLASHILGYVSQWEKADIPDGFKHYIGDAKGIDGIEKTMDDFLKGTEGIQTILKNNKGKTLGVTDNKRSGSGAEVTLTLDAELQYLTETVLRHVGRASAVVLDPNTGEILAMASTPDYNPNDYIPKIHPDVLKAYIQNKAQPFNNAAIRNFTPGSTFKLPTAIAACMHGKATFSHNCIGYIKYGKLKCRCWKTWGHGDLALSEAIQRSCNPFFMQLASVIGADNLVEAFGKLGFGKRTGVRLPGESSGIVPGSRAWMRSNRGNRLTPAISGMTTIGQADSECSPLQMASLVASIANRGHLYTPRIIKSVKHPLKNIAFPNRPHLKLNLLREGVNIEDLEKIRHGMWLAANKTGGTAGRAALADIEIGAKTGTAQTSDAGLKTNVSWTVAFAPYDSPLYVVAVAVRRGTSGGKVAGPLVNLILQGAFARKNGLKLPLKKMVPAIGNFDIIDEIKIPKKNALDVLFAPPVKEEERTEENSIIVVNPEPEEETPTDE